MSELALLGGRPLACDFWAEDTLVTRPDLERHYLLEAHDGAWDDFPQQDSMASRFAAEWAAFNGSPHCALVTNGTHSLQLALEALDIGAGDEVIVPGLTWQATASVVCDINAAPILVDIDPETLCLDPSLVEEAITPRTKAVIPVHLFNRMCDIDRILEIAARHGLHVIEDCAHAHGSLWNGKNAGTFGCFGSFSFQNSKLVRSGEGGALLTSSEALHWRIVSQKSCGRSYGGEAVHSGNYRLSCFQAAVLLGQLAAFRENAPRIDEIGRGLDNAVRGAPGTRPLRRDDRQTRSCGFCYAFLYDRNAFDGLEAKLFREALSAELGITVIPPYTPLSHSEVYYPQTKRRHQLSPDYMEKISPSRWNLPASEEAWKNRAMVVPWKHAFRCPPERTGLLGQAIAKIHRRRDELLTRAPSLPAAGAVEPTPGKDDESGSG